MEMRNTPKFPRTAKGFKIKAELKLTPDKKGIGVFAAQFIPANTRVDDHSIIYYNEQETLEYLASLPNDEERKKWLEHSFSKDGKLAAYDANVDDGGMINHSFNPTMKEDIDGHSYTTRDVQDGEELTEDYTTYEEVDFCEKLYEKYGVEDCYMNSENNNNNDNSNSKITF